MEDEEEVERRRGCYRGCPRELTSHPCGRWCSCFLHTPSAFRHTKHQPNFLSRCVLFSGRLIRFPASAQWAKCRLLMLSKADDNGPWATQSRDALTRTGSRTSHPADSWAHAHLGAHRFRHPGGVPESRTRRTHVAHARGFARFQHAAAPHCFHTARLKTESYVFEQIHMGTKACCLQLERALRNKACVRN